MACHDAREHRETDRAALAILGLNVDEPGHLKGQCPPSAGGSESELSYGERKCKPFNVRLDGLLSVRGVFYEV